MMVVLSSLATSHVGTLSEFENGRCAKDHSPLIFCDISAALSTNSIPRGEWNSLLHAEKPENALVLCTITGTAVRGCVFRAMLQPVDGAMPQPVIALAIAFGDHLLRRDCGVGQ